jgi:plastocyanin
MRVLTTVAAVALCAGLVSSGAFAHDHSKRDHHVITIDNMSVHPSTATVSADDVVVWVNYSDHKVAVKFPGSVEDQLECAAEPKFHKTGDGGLISAPIGPLEFAMPCKLKPGTYEYRITGGQAEGLEVGADPEQESPGDPKGKIIVE